MENYMGDFRYNGITGHRGNPEQAPENTLESFENAMRLGVDFVETDVHLTADGRLILCHNSDTLATCGEKLVIAESSSSELRRLNASYAFNSQHDVPFADTRLPFLEEFLELGKSYPDVRLSLQPKASCVEEICAMVKRMGMSNRIAFNDGNLQYMLQAKRLIPEAVIFYDTHGSAQLEEGIAIAKQEGFFSIVSHYPQMTPERCDAIRAAGLEAGVWNIDDMDAIRRFIGMGVFRFYTNRPKEALELKKELHCLPE